jgi:hypothetical protein
MSSLTPPDTATYIRRDECIRSSPQNDLDGLTGSIVGIGIHNNQPSFTTPTNVLIGEIEEIRILDPNMNTLAVHNKLSHSRYSVQKSPEQKREELLRKRND